MNAIAETGINQFSKWFELHPKLGISMMDHLYNRLDGAYPHKWRSNFKDETAIDNWRISWAESFEEEKISLQEVANGLKVCRTKFDWPPSCAEFIKACRPVADSMKAYYEAVNGVQARAKGEMGIWSHPAIYWAAMPLSFDLGNQTYSQIKIRWEAAYNEQMDRGEWADIPQPALALPAPGRAQLSRENATKMLNQLGASGVLKKTNGNDTWWYRKILVRIESGDKTVTLIQRRFAEEAAAAHGYRA
ncbi:MAG: hypothetical protein K2Y28_11750 [Burkholderiaceae bacterium]|nr:hypothetical protein [Burkholderiaceae bacterium]